MQLPEMRAPVTLLSRAKYVITMHFQ